MMSKAKIFCTTNANALRNLQRNLILVDAISISRATLISVFQGFCSPISIVLRATTSIYAKFLSILQKKNLLFLFYTPIFTTHTSVCPFYYLFYLNNNFPHFLLLFISNSLSLYSQLSQSLSILHMKILSPFTVNCRSKHRSTIVETCLFTRQALICHKHQSTMVETCRSTSTNSPHAPIYKRQSTLSVSVGAYVCGCV